jgi:uncharacterized protein YgbK (DUF1537 family)
MKCSPYDMFPQRIGIIADDLTGATDTASVFAAAGFRSAVAIDSKTLNSSDAQVLCVSTNTRQEKPELAASKVRQASDRLRRAGYSIRYKKLDSTAKGNILAEAVALRDHLGFPKILICTANPKHGRTVIQGTLWIRNETAVDLRLRFKGQTSNEILWVHQPISATRLQRLLPGSPAVWVCDAADAKDLSKLVRWAEAHSGEFLLTGSAGMAVELAELLKGESMIAGHPRGKRLRSEPASPPLPGGRKPVLLIIGSNDPRTAEQLEVLTQQRLTLQLNPTASLPLALESTLIRAGVVVLRLPVNQATPEFLRRCLKPLKPLLAEQRFGSLLMSGGDTALLVCEWLGTTGIAIGGELLPGLVWGRLQEGISPGLVVCTKPGGFGTGESLVTATDVLTGQRAQVKTAKPKNPVEPR